MTTTEKKEMELKGKQALEKSSGEPTRGGLWFVPNVDIHESPTELVVSADMPGVKSEGVDVDLKDGVLTITGTVATNPSGRRLIYHEYDVGGFTRQFTLGDVIDQSKISAKLADGVLTVILPKGEKAKPRKVLIGS